MSKILRNSIDKIFKDKEGNYVIAQRPNWPLWVWLVIKLSMLFVEKSYAHDLLSVFSSVILIIWATMEIYSGVNYFRRFLGTVVLFYTILSLFN